MNHFLVPPALMNILTRYFFIFAGLGLISACADNSRTTQLLSENQNSRVSIIVIHHTTADFGESLNLLTQPSSHPVSAHYLIPEPNDETYTGNKLKIFALVPETHRAWHAGLSYWAEKSGLNDQSIGIELVNQTYCAQPETENAEPDDAVDDDNPPRQLCFYPDFAESQISLLIGLLRGILERHPGILPINIVGHSDIAPDRKVDPGPRFPWQRLYQLGFGAWFDDETVIKYWKKFITTPMPLINIQRALHAYGYDIEDTGLLDKQTKNVLRAFQMHFRPLMVTSMPNLESTAILYALIDKYRPKLLDELLTIDTPTEEMGEGTKPGRQSPPKRPDYQR